MTTKSFKPYFIDFITNDVFDLQFVYRNKPGSIIEDIDILTVRY